MGKYRDILIIIAVVLAISLPFINRAYFVDDFYHVTMARGIIDNPLRPYDFRSDDNEENVRSWEPGGFPRMVNPPLMHYYLALIIKYFGAEEWKLRLGYLVFPVMAALGMFFLGRRFSEEPMAPALLFIVTPVFWLSAHTLLIDMCMLAFLLWGYELFMRGWEDNNWIYLLLAGLALGLAPMVKYTAYSAIVILLFWVAVHKNKERDKFKYLGVLLIPAAIFIGWYAWNVLTYGESHLLASLKRSGSGPIMPKLIVGLSFLSGVSVFTVIFQVLAFDREKIWFYLSLAALFPLVLYLSSPSGGFLLSQAWLLAFLIINSVLFITILLRRSKKLDPFLLIWFFAGFFMFLVTIPWVAGRYYLYIMPPLILMTLSVIKNYYKPVHVFKIITFMLLFTGCFSLFLVKGDYAQAEAYRRIAGDVENTAVVKALSGKKIVFGDTFFGYSHYLKKRGWRVIFDQSVVEKGDLVLKAAFSLPTFARLRWSLNLKEVQRIEYPACLPVRVMDIPSSAGFYASAGGALPFSFTKGPLEVFVLYEVE